MRRSLLIAAVTLLPAVATATPFELIYEGSLSAGESLVGANGTDLITAPTAFKVRAWFDTTSPDLSIPPLPGWVSYAPSQAFIEIAGVTYSIVGHSQDPLFGVTVNVFDPTNIFNPGLYGVGLFANPIQDGAGFVGDFSNSTSPFVVTNLRTTEFTGYNGAGFLSGIRCFPAGPDCTFQPWTLRDVNGALYSLGFANRQEEVADGATVASAQIRAVPEPGSVGLLAAGLWLLGRVRRRQQVS